ncbi:MAG: efflux RND transporter periplasmic adaptor subunit [Candidatus Eisenbacteria bacterium]|nr:efflux RND transporter periplasmic adaptor subunit [Candidatus Eisenbacteria bacterium]
MDEKKDEKKDGQMTSEQSGRRRKIWTAIRILNVRLRFIFLMVVTGLVAANWENIANHWERWTRPESTKAAIAEASEYEYYCPMHPSVVRDAPGNCPICGMPLARRHKGEAPELPSGTITRVQLSPYRMELGNVATSEVGYRPVEREIRTVGTIEIDERRTARISARVSGRIERLHVDFTGQPVASGAPLVEIYSPELISTQNEYLLAVQAQKRLRDAGGMVQADAASLVGAARRRLELWGMEDRQIRALEARGEPSATTTIYAPIGGIVTEKKVVPGQYVSEGSDLYAVADLSHVWATAFVYEADADQVKQGQRVTVSPSGSDREYAGTVAFVYPVLESSTRTVRLRIDVPNPQLELRPGAYVDVRIEEAGSGSGRGAATTSLASNALAATERWVCPMDAEWVSDRPGKCPLCGMDLVKEEVPPAGGAGTLTVPRSAVIDTGTRKVVYLEREPGTFDAVEVKLGPVAGDYYPVLEGLRAGDRVVTAGAFLVDAESRLNPAAGSAYFGASGTGTSGSAAGGSRAPATGKDMDMDTDMDMTQPDADGGGQGGHQH